MQTVLQDLRYAFRQLRRSPGFALTAILTLALAIGVSTSVFSVLDATVVRPLPYNQPGRIVSLQTYTPQGYTQVASWLQYVDLRFGVLLIGCVNVAGLLLAQGVRRQREFGLRSKVVLRTRDIGVRMALGSSSLHVVRGILRRVAVLMLTGIAAGWLLTYALRKAIATVVILDPARDFVLLLSLTATLGFVGLAACLLPARRAASINPIEALRNE